MSYTDYVSLGMCNVKRYKLSSNLIPMECFSVSFCPSFMVNNFTVGLLSFSTFTSTLFSVTTGGRQTKSVTS